MPKWLTALVAFLAGWWGRRSGRAAQVQADQTAALKQQVEVERAVSKAEATAPTDRAGVVNRLRNRDF